MEANSGCGYHNYETSSSESDDSEDDSKARKEARKAKIAAEKAEKARIAKEKEKMQNFNKPLDELCKKFKNVDLNGTPMEVKIVRIGRKDEQERVQNFRVLNFILRKYLVK